MKVYGYYTFVYDQDTNDYLPDRGFVVADSLEEAIEKIKEYNRGDKQEIIHLELFKSEVLDDDDGVFSIYEWLSDCMIKPNELQYELKDWFLI